MSMGTAASHQRKCESATNTIAGMFSRALMWQSPLRHEFLLKATRINAGVAATFSHSPAAPATGDRAKRQASEASRNCLHQGGRS